MRALVGCRIKPYYLHHGDLAPGHLPSAHTNRPGQALIRTLHGRVSGLCQPAYVLAIPGGHGKSPIGPSYIRAVPAGPGGQGFEIEDFKGGRHIYPPRAAARVVSFGGRSRLFGSQGQSIQGRSSGGRSSRLPIAAASSLSFSIEVTILAKLASDMRGWNCR